MDSSINRGFVLNYRMKNIYIVGFMGVGKTTVGKKLANKLGWNFIDTDILFEEKYKLNIDTFFEKYGEDLFRKLEHEVLLSTFSLTNCVISTGGGMPCHFGAMKKINNNGISIYLSMNENAILNRLSSSKQRRPLVINKTDEELRLFISTMLAKRIPFYSMAKLTMSAISINIDLIVENLKA